MSLVFAVLLVSAQAAADTQPAATPEATSPAAAPKKEKKICKADDPDPGSHMSKRVCRTAAEWAQQNMYGSSRSGISISGEKLEDH